MTVYFSHVIPEPVVVTCNFSEHGFLCCTTNDILHSPSSLRNIQVMTHTPRFHRKKQHVGHGFTALNNIFQQMSFRTVWFVILITFGGNCLNVHSVPLLRHTQDTPHTTSGISIWYFYELEISVLILISCYTSSVKSGTNARDIQTSKFVSGVV